MVVWFISALMAASGGGDFVEQPKKLKLYSFWLSPCAFRVRIALNLKGLEYEYEAVDLFKGEQFSPEFSRLNPLNYVPVLVDGSIVMADSLAIIMYLEEKYPEHPLLPSDPQKKAINYQVASIVSSSIQPLQNLAVLKSLEEKFNADERQEWVHYHIKRGFEALEKLLKDHAGKYATGDEASLADVFLASELVYSSKTLNMDLSEFPLLNNLNTVYGELPAFHAALPEKQPDAPAT